MLNITMKFNKDASLNKEEYRHPFLKPSKPRQHEFNKQFEF
jgi:hypothetical protein